MVSNNCCEPVICKDFLAMITVFRIIVLTYNRPYSVSRLLKSINEADYDFEENPNWRLILEIRIDVGGGQDGEAVQTLAKKFKFDHGWKEVLIEKDHKGIENGYAWSNAWSWRDKELFIILEDDVELSPHWYRALVNMWTKYFNHPHASGISLQHQTFTAVAGSASNNVNISDRVTDLVYMYQLPSSIGFSPHPCHWWRFIELYGDILGQCPPHTLCNGQVWESWWLKYHQDNLLYTVYAADQGAFAVDHREVGYHHSKSPGRLCDKISIWNPSRCHNLLPNSPQMLDLYLNDDFPLAKCAWLANRIAKFSYIILLRFILTKEDFQTVKNQITKHQKEGKDFQFDLVNMTLFVVHSDEHEKGLGRLGVQQVVTIKQPAVTRNSNISSKYSANLIKMTCLTTIASLWRQDVKVVSLPPEISLREFPAPKRTIMTPVAAGKLSSQKHPRLDFLYLDGSETTFEIMKKLFTEMIAPKADFQPNIFVSLVGKFPNKIWSWA